MSAHHDEAPLHHAEVQQASGLGQERQSIHCTARASAEAAEQEVDFAAVGERLEQAAIDLFGLCGPACLLEFLRVPEKCICVGHEGN